MAQITVTVRSDKGDLGTHIKHGELAPGRKLIIEEEEFSAELFDRPAGFVSPHEQADKARAEELQQSVGTCEHKAASEAPSAPPVPSGTESPDSSPKKGGK